MVKHRQPSMRYELGLASSGAEAAGEGTSTMKLNRLPPRLATATPAKGWSAEGRGSASERGYGHEWRKVRDAVMVRDHGLCQPCKRRGLVTLAREVDHIVGKYQGGTDHPANLQAICVSCHQAKTAAERHGGEWDGRPSTEA